jgi:hypothetical protein
VTPESASLYLVFNQYSNQVYSTRSDYRRSTPLDRMTSRAWTTARDGIPSFNAMSAALRWVITDRMM